MQNFGSLSPVFANFLTLDMLAPRKGPVFLLITIEYTYLAVPGPTKSMHIFFSNYIGTYLTLLISDLIRFYNMYDNMGPISIMKGE